jgi:hypothetical protein
MIHEPASENKVWERTFAEASEVMAQCSFSQYRGDYRRGKTLAVLADPRIDESGRSLEVLVTCQVFGHRKTRWLGNVIVLRAEKPPDDPFAFSFLNFRGQAGFTALPVQGYRLSLEPHREQLWAGSARIPFIDQIERQAWLEPESVCRALYARAAKLAPLKPGKPNDAFETLLLLSGRLESRLARPALQACLGILCDRRFPATLRASASDRFIPQSTRLLADIDLSPFALELSQAGEVEVSSESAGELEDRLFGAFGAVLSARPVFGKNEKDLLSALVARSRLFGAARREQAVRTRGAVPARGTFRKHSASLARGGGYRAKTENLLLVLARSGGRRVRSALAEILKEQKADYNLLLILESQKT